MNARKFTVCRFCSKRRQRPIGSTRFEILRNIIEILQYRIFLTCKLFISTALQNSGEIPFIFFFIWPRVSSRDCFEVFGFPISHSRSRGTDSIKTPRAINKPSISRSTLPCPSILQFEKRVSSVHTEINFSRRPLRPVLRETFKDIVKSDLPGLLVIFHSFFFSLSLSDHKIGWYNTCLVSIV